MESPFIYIGEVSGDLFIGRNEDIAWLSSNMLKGIHSVVIAPSRFGKTSLIRQAIAQAQKDSLVTLKVCYISLFNVRSEFEFYKKLATEVLKSVATTVDDWKQYCAEHFSGTCPELIVDQRYNTVKIKFNETHLAKQIKETLAFIAHLSSETQPYIICLDDFQNMEIFDTTDATKCLLIKQINKQSNVCYIFSGSDVNAMRLAFVKKKPKIGFQGDVIELEPYTDKVFPDYIVKAFSKSGRSITKEQAEKIMTKTKGHPYYMQLFAHLIWGNTKGYVTEQVIDATETELLAYCSTLFLAKIDTLNLSQINYLRAIIEGIDRFCSIEAMDEYQFNSSAHVKRVREALLKKELIEFKRTRPLFIDPVFKLWFENVYLEQ